MLHDVQDGKIKAIVCYKLDRVGRKTADLGKLGYDNMEMCIRDSSTIKREPEKEASSRLFFLTDEEK